MRLLANNKSAFFNYEIIKQFEAGIILEGWEVRSTKAGKISIKESFIKLKNLEAFLEGAHISMYSKSDKSVYMNEYRSRKLLLNKEEILKLNTGSTIKGNTVVPLKIYEANNRKIKVLIGLARGKKLYDKRIKLKEKDLKRQISRDLLHNER